MGRDCSVGRATRYGLGGLEIEFRREARFSTAVQTGPGVHPGYSTNGVESFLEVKRPGRGFNYPPSSSAKVKEIEQQEFLNYFCAMDSFDSLGKSTDPFSEKCI